METEKNIISGEEKLSAIAAVMFFAPFVKNRIKLDSSFTEEEKDFIVGYFQIGFINIAFLVIILTVVVLNFFIDSGILSWIITVSSLAIFIISIFSIFACVNDLFMRNRGESIKQKIQHKGEILKVYTPVINFIIRFRQENYNMPYWRLKESILLWTFFVFGTLIFGNPFGIGVLVIIIIRVVLLLLNVDIIPLSIKKAINSMFLCNPSEMFAYIFAPIVSKMKKSDYETILHARKQGYMLGQNFGIGIILQYFLFIGILSLIYYGIDISLDNIVLFCAVILWVLRVIIFYINKKTLLKIPILSEIVSLIFH